MSRAPGPRRPGRVPRVLLALYVLTLLWLTLFKLSYDIPTILVEHRTRSVNLIPFTGLGNTGLSETVSNLVVFIPLGLLLAMNFTRTAARRLLAVVLITSTAIEALQLLLAIGATDVTDVFTNTVGGTTGLVLYRLLRRGLPAPALDAVIATLGAVLFVAFLLLRLLVFQVRY